VAAATSASGLAPAGQRRLGRLLAALRHPIGRRRLLELLLSLGRREGVDPNLPTLDQVALLQHRLRRLLRYIDRRLFQLELGQRRREAAEWLAHHWDSETMTYLSGVTARTLVAELGEGMRTYPVTPSWYLLRHNGRWLLAHRRVVAVRIHPRLLKLPRRRRMVVQEITPGLPFATPSDTEGEGLETFLPADYGLDPPFSATPPSVGETLHWPQELEGGVTEGAEAPLPPTYGGVRLVLRQRWVLEVPDRSRADDFWWATEELRNKRSNRDQLLLEGLLRHQFRHQ
jgi:hypothetical protein